VNGAGNTGAYQLDDVSVVYRPAGHAAKTECVDPTMAGAASVLSGNLVRNPWIEDLQPSRASWRSPAASGRSSGDWQVGGALVASVEDGVLRFHDLGRRVYADHGGPTPVGDLRVGEHESHAPARDGLAAGG
jgi:hypothetical protein